jgi:hypothetical protein
VRCQRMAPEPAVFTMIPDWLDAIAPAWALLANNLEREGPMRASQPGWALQRLINLYQDIRDDLALLRHLAFSIGHHEVDAEGASVVLDRLSFREPGWTLRTYCAVFCGFVREHHATEDSMLFPMLLHQRQNGDLADVIDRLRADHRTLTGLLDDVERAVGVLPADPAATAAATDAIERLTEQLQAHLAFEERSLAPALNAISRVVSEHDARPPADARALGAEIDATIVRRR